MLQNMTTQARPDDSGVIARDALALAADDSGVVALQALALAPIGRQWVKIAPLADLKQALLERGVDLEESLQDVTWPDFDHPWMKRVLIERASGKTIAKAAEAAHTSPQNVHHQRGVNERFRICFERASLIRRASEGGLINGKRSCD